MLSRWDPFEEMFRVQREWPGQGGQARGVGFAPAVDIFEGDTAITVKAEVPGLDAKDIHIDVENNILTLRGERKFENEDKRDGYHRIERSYGAFTRSFIMPSTVDGDAIEATINHGVLTVTLPKKATKQPRKINVKSTSATSTEGSSATIEQPTAASAASPQTGGTESTGVSSGSSVQAGKNGRVQPAQTGSARQAT